jgi:hypothetical protein
VKQIIAWTKSSHSSGGGGSDCVEIAVYETERSG